MNRHIHFFSQKDGISGKIDAGLLGVRGRELNELAELGFPILPGFILDAEIASEIDAEAIKKDIKVLLDKCALIVGKKYGDAENPLLLKVLVSGNLALSAYPALHNFGLVRSTVAGFAELAGRDFAAREILFLIRGMLKVEERIRETEGKVRTRDEISARLKILDRTLGIAPPSNELNGRDKPLKIDKSAEAYIDEYAKYFPAGFFDNAEEQLLIALSEISKMLRLDPLTGEKDTALLIQPMAYGYGRDSCIGTCFSRNVLTGEKKLQGEFYQGSSNEAGAQGIEKIKGKHLKELQRIAWTLEDRFRDIRQLRFAVENGNLWLIEQGPAEQKSVRADIKLLLDLEKRKIVDKAYAVKALKPRRLNEILHPLIDTPSVKGLKHRKGGIAGAPGAAVGRAYFSTARLLKARALARQKGEDDRFILVLESSFAEDLKAIEVSAGVLTSQGGYAAHASVIARQYGKVSLVAPDLKIKGKKANLGNFTFSEGDYLTLDVPFYTESVVYAGAAKLIEPDPKESGLLEFIALVSDLRSELFTRAAENAAGRGAGSRRFQVRANAESPCDAALALSFGAEGIGLCRTEHMFFQAERLKVFQKMLLGNEKERKQALAKLLVMQRSDFFRLFKVMAGKDLCIRLLDAPLHEFIPDAFHESNPMLGRRGCRIAVSYPEIYAMQVQAIFEAAYKLQKEKIEVHLEIMVPMVMNAAELRLIAYGKNVEGASYAGIADIEEELRQGQKARPLDYQIGAMIELPAAALGAADIARYARFFSFGTNDLTQTALGISRDDFTGFMGDYTRFDLIPRNPFSVLDGRVKELITLAVERGRLTRPDLICGLCGEHGANAENMEFCMDAGLDYVSCSPYAVPVAVLAAAQAEIMKEK
ncbi:pyruvate, phosphate dikinase [Spirochaetia bacterium]|nr:pyruvate, phosphate dikinase [Spirochaetia bacterium]